MESVLIVIICFASAMQLYFWIIQLGSLNRYVPLKKGVKESTSSVSVIIAAKNEHHHLQRHIDKWLNQDYIDCEIIIIDDHSSDETEQYFQRWDNQRLRFLNLPKGLTGKKAAISYGIKQSQAEWILTTDADCYPHSSSWINHMMKQSRSSDVILGYSPHISFHALIGRWIQYETWFIAMQYLSAAITGQPYMGVGRNLLFRRSVFEEVQGYSSHDHIKSGDDDLFISSLRSKVRYAICTDQKSWVWTYPEKNISDYINQKRRHLTTAPHYPPHTKIKLTIIYLSQMLWYAGLMCLSVIQPIFLFLLLIRYVILAVIAFRSRDKLGRKPHFLLVPFYDFGLCIFYLFMSFTFLMPKKDW